MYYSILVGGKNIQSATASSLCWFLCCSLLCQDDHDGGGDDGDFKSYDRTAFDDYDAIYCDNYRSC